MAGAILENLSGRKLAILVSILFICQIVCFLLGGLVAPAPANADTILGTACKETEINNTVWYFPRGKTRNCPDKSQLKNLKDGDDYNDVFTFQIPLPRDNVELDYSRWQQNLIGILQPEIEYIPGSKKLDHIITLKSRLGYRNKGDPSDAWKLYAFSDEERRLDCSIDKPKPEYFYDCSIIPLFELGSLHHDFYLLNIRVPRKKGDHHDLFNGLYLVAIIQNGGFTKVWVSLKTVFFPFIVAIMIWFWNRVHQLPRPPALLEYMLMFLGSALTLLNLPLEYLTLAFDMPYMLLLGDIRQGIFYAALLSFWLVFAGEHLMDDLERNTLKAYWKHLSAVAAGCMLLFVFDMCERGIQLRNPFYSIWVTDIGTNLALSFIILAGISAGVYFFFLSYMIWKVFCNISTKRAALPSMSSMRRQHYEGVIYRFKFLMLATLVCAAMTVIGFILGQVSEGRWKWDDDIELEYTSAFFTGVYGMWNIYIFALIVLYAPSHKQWPSESEHHSCLNEEIEFSRLPTEPSEISSLTSFTRKSAID